MAITAIDIYKDNKVGDCDLLNVASPLVYLVDVTYNTAPPDNLYARLYDKDNVKLGYYRCMPLKDLSNTIRRFAFYADEIFRQYIPPLDDFTQSSGTLVEVVDAVKQFKIVFSDNKNEAAAAGYHIKSGSMAGITVSQTPYFITLVISDGVSGGGVGGTYPFYGEDFPLTDARFVDRFTAIINAQNPTFLGTKALMYLTPTGYAIRNNTTSNCIYTTMPSRNPVPATCETFPAPVIEAETTFNAINAASQIGQYEANQFLFNNEQQKIIGIARGNAYAYFYDSDGNGVVSASIYDSVNYEMLSLSEFTIVDDVITTQVNHSVIKFTGASNGHAAFSAAGNFSKIQIKIDEVIGSMPLGNTNTIYLSYFNGAAEFKTIGALGVGVHEIPLNAALQTNSIRLFINSTGETKSISLDYIRLVSSINPC